MQRKALLAALMLIACSVGQLRGQSESRPRSQISGDAAQPSGDAAQYVFRYHCQPGEQLRYRVEHNATVETTIQGNTQKTRSHSESTKVWQIEPRAESEQIRFSYRVEDAQMWSEISGRQRVEYDSRREQPPPSEYASVAETLNKTLTTITMNPWGEVVDRQDAKQQSDLGFGELVLAFPEEPIAVGAHWTSPFELKVRTEDGRYKTIKAQHRYELEKVQTGVATIRVRSQILTPVSEPSVEAQLVQRMSAGQIRFDLDRGRILSKTLEWDKSVVAFNGADSHMRYSARFTEELVDSGEVAQRQAAESTTTK